MIHPARRERRPAGGGRGRPALRARCGVRSPALLVLPLAVFAAGGCTGRRAPYPFEEGVQARSLQIEVENHGFNEATVRAVSRMERRLGVVSGNGKQTFTIPWTTVDELQIRIDILAGSRFTTNRVTAGPGETVYLTIREPLYRSLLRR